MPPVVWRDVGRIDAERFHSVDRLEHPLDPGPALRSQQTLTAGADERQCLISLTGGDGTHDVGAREDGAVVVGRPADEAKTLPEVKLTTRR